MKLFRQLWFLVLAATAMGAALGLADPSLGVAMKPLGDGFIALIKLLVAPVIFCTVVHGLSAMGDLRRAGRVAAKALVYFEAVTTLALAAGLMAANLARPGAGMHVNAAALDPASVAAYVAQARHQTIQDFLLDIIPNTFVGAFTQANVLQVLLVSVLFACGVVAAGPVARPLAEGIGRLSKVVFAIVALAMWAAPLGAFGAMAFTVGKFGPGALASLGGLILEFYGLSLAFVTLVFGAIAMAVGVSLIRLLAYIRDEILVVAATTSTETVLPRLIEKLTALGCEESVVGLVVPAGYAFNLDGACLYLGTAVLFLAQATGVSLNLGQQLGLLAVMLFTSKGAAGVPGAAFVVLAATVASTGILPVVSVAILLGVHRLMAEAMTFVNLVGNTLAAIVVARWEQAVDLDILFDRVGARRLRAPTAAALPS
ncbi:MAG TPA: cation:dicarboxylase symporter family transporter [Caulobacteraceae bacterium]